MCDEGIQYYSEAYKRKIPDSQLRKLKAKILNAKNGSAMYQWNVYNDAPEYENETDCEDPIGAAKLFHKVSFNLQKIDKEFFQKFIESKHFDKLENLKLFLCDELDIKDIYEDHQAGEEKEMFKFMDARELILKLLNICCEGKEDILNFVSHFKTDESLKQIDTEWVKDNYKAIRIVFGEYGRLRDKRRVANNTEEEINVFESKKAVTGLLARILKQYLGLSINTNVKQKQEKKSKYYQTEYSVEDVDEIFELLMYMDERYGKSDKFTEFIRGWATDKHEPCKWYHLYDPNVTGKSIHEAAKGIYELEMVDDDDQDEL